MHDSVRETFLPFSTRFEGRVNTMYLDIKGLVTIGVGNLIDHDGDPAPALALPFVHNADGSPATQDEILAEWQALKADQSLATAGWRTAAQRTSLMLTDEDIDTLVLAKADEFESTLKRTTSEFADFDAWPADAQLGVLSMAWAMGPAFGQSWPTFRRAVGANDWRAAAQNCRMSEAGNPGLVPRNDADEELFGNAAVAVEEGLDFSVLQYQPPRPTLRAGSSGADVEYLQKTLVNAGYAVDVTGIFDAATGDAVREVQAANGLPADGLVGPKTWSVLD